MDRKLSEALKIYAVTGDAVPLYRVRREQGLFDGEIHLLAHVGFEPARATLPSSPIWEMESFQDFLQTVDPDIRNHLLGQIFLETFTYIFGKRERPRNWYTPIFQLILADGEVYTSHGFDPYTPVAELDPDILKKFMRQVRLGLPGWKDMWEKHDQEIPIPTSKQIRQWLWELTKHLLSMDQSEFFGTPTANDIHILSLGDIYLGMERVLEATFLIRETGLPRQYENLEELFDEMIEQKLLDREQVALLAILSYFSEENDDDYGTPNLEYVTERRRWDSARVFSELCEIINRYLPNQIIQDAIINAVLLHHVRIESWGDITNMITDDFQRRLARDST